MSKGTILIIDDDEDLATATRHFLEAKGYAVLHSRTGIEGVERVRLDHPDLVLLDLMMETHDAGFAVARTLKGDPVTRAVPILMVSGVREKTKFAFDFERDRHWMKTDGFLEKPYLPESLLERVEAILAARAQTV
jgi:CheY-like chemotaxis protein